MKHFYIVFFENIRASFVDLEGLGLKVDWILAHLDKLHALCMELKLMPKIRQKEDEITILQKEIDGLRVMLK